MKRLLLVLAIALGVTTTSGCATATPSEVAKVQLDVAAIQADLGADVPDALAIAAAVEAKNYLKAFLLADTLLAKHSGPDDRLVADLRALKADVRALFTQDDARLAGLTERAPAAVSAPAAAPAR